MKQPVSYKQTDSRWGSLPYSNRDERATIYGSGCGPTCTAMIIATLADSNVTPIDTCAWSVAHGYKATGMGTYNTYFVPQLAAYGIHSEYLSAYCYHNTGHASHAKVKTALQAGNWVIANVGPGIWTSGGHFILVYGIDSADNVYINDPASSRDVRAKNTWANLSYQTKYYWIVQVPDSWKSGNQTPQQPENTYAKNYLVKGDKGAAVGTMQTMLKALGHYTGQIDNSFGPLSDTAVRSFQRASGLAIDGSYGPATKAATEKAYAAWLAGSNSGNYTVGKNYRLNEDMKVRVGAGTGYAWKAYSQLTSDGKRHAYGQNGYAVLKAGTTVTAMEIVRQSSTEIWMRIPSGWVAAVYGGRKYIG